MDARSRRPFLGLAIIARDEEATLPGLLDSVRAAVDEVVLVDTGSTDATLAIFQAWACEELAVGRLLRAHAGHFEWCDDFAAARNYAHSLLRAEWHLWADCDDVIHGAENLRALAQEAAAVGATSLFFEGDRGPARDRGYRARLARPDLARWRFPVHEAWRADDPDGEDGPRGLMVPPRVARWEERKPANRASSSGYYLSLIRRWLDSDPKNYHALTRLYIELAEASERAAHRGELREAAEGIEAARVLGLSMLDGDPPAAALTLHQFLLAAIVALAQARERHGEPSRDSAADGTQRVPTPGQSREVPKISACCPYTQE